MKPAIIVHGGLKKLEPHEHARFKQGCLAAVHAGWRMLTMESSALDAAEAAVRVLEDDPVFNAGFGSALNADGKVELDAAIMDGSTLKAGAVGAIRGVCHPITVARQLMDSGLAVMLTGDGAHRFAVQQRQELCPVDALITEEQHKQWDTHDRKLQPASKDTVGCVVLDQFGNIAAATSTGGLLGKMPGRVGDSPLIGCGLYADELGGVSLTGDGESIIRGALASRIITHLHGGLPPQSAAEAAIQFFASRLPGEAGCIVLDRQGRIGFAHHSDNIACAYMNADMTEPVASVGRKSEYAQ